MIFKALKLITPRFSKTYSKVMYEAWKNNPKDVHEDWHAVFNNQDHTSSVNVGSPQHIEKEKSLALSAYMLIRYYKTRGHQQAELDPLGLVNFKEFGKIYIKNKLQHDLINNKIFQNKNLDQPFTFPSNSIFQDKIAGFIHEKQEWTLREILHRLQFIYSNKTGLQFMHLSNSEEKAWLMHEFEKLSNEQTLKEEKISILHELVKAETFNSFLSDKLKTSKRFGVEGLDSMISGLNKLVEEASKSGIEYIGLGMAHRGRLNALANVFNKPLQKIFAEFQENVDKESWGNSGDVKYHLGATTQRQISGKNIRLTILPNPSHLQTVNPVVMGHVKAVKDELKNEEKTLGVLIHGDAAVAGQGVVYQCLQMAYLNHYNINGVIHIVANNQIGFTTTPAEARTGLYCTNVAKSIQAPIIHVNADEPELVNKVIKLAVNYRQKFKKDIFVDIIGYRRYGHNEQDQPAFTQPMMYQTIGKRPTTYHLYSQKLIKEGVISEEQSKQIWLKQLSKVSEAYTQSLKSSFNIKNWRAQTYHRVVDFTKLGEIKKTGISNQILSEIGQKISNVPESFNINPTIKKIYDQRRLSINTGQNIDYGTAETLAYGSLLKEGFNVRLAGQDVERGTFSHRHAVLTDQKTQEKYTPLLNLLNSSQKNRLQIQNSLLSQYAAMGFEYGYALTNPNTLTIWEAQFGDFANGAQIIIDNYVTSGQSKWTVQNGLVLNLPHGMDGQGPQHSSGRIQRFLQMMSDNWTDLIVNNEPRFDSSALRNINMAVICCSNAGNIFHSLRRQMRRDYRKPLIHFVNKKLLKLRQAGTTFAELNRDHFDTMIDDTTVNPQQVKKVVLLYGQAYYSALEKRTTIGRKDVALVRVQQLAPLHYSALVRILQKYSNATQFIWFQQQHRNSGAWGYVYPRISIVLEWLHKNNKVRTSLFQCVSRKTSASTAVGKKKKHDEEQVQILNKLFEN